MINPSLRTTTLGLAVTLAMACGESESAKPEAALPNLINGKADTSSVANRGVLEFGSETAIGNRIPEPLKFDAYEVEMAEGGIATLEVSQKGTSRGFDSLLFLYGPKDAQGGFGELIARDDDSGWGPLSRIKDFKVPQTGTYMLVVGTYEGSGFYRVQATCESGDCVPAPSPTVQECVFGGSYYDLVTKGTPATSIVQKTAVTGPSELSETQADQLVDSLVYAGFDDVDSVEKAFQTVDAGEVNVVQVWDASSRRAFEVFEYALGDTSVGAIYAAGTLNKVAVISDLDIYDCKAFVGVERQDCWTDGDCLGDLKCVGVVSQVGSCIDTGLRPEGDQLDCNSSLDCPWTNGLVCAGENFGGGICNPAWMRRHFSQVSEQSISGEVTNIELLSYGLASVHTDVSLDLFIIHPDYSQLRVTLVNPTGTESVIHDQDADAREIYLRREAIMGFPSDEDANGTWTLRIENLNPELSGTVVDFGLEITSRWD
jgi:hypothetical protein